jgi:predicted RNase H-like HicB family nuclease
MTSTVEIEQEDDGRWIAEVLELPGTLTYGQIPEKAKAKVQALALRLVAARLDHGEAGSDLLSISFVAARVPGPARERDESLRLCRVWAGASNGKMGPIVSSLAPDGPTSSLPSTTLKRSVLACSPASPSIQGLNPKTCGIGATAITT